MKKMQFDLSKLRTGLLVLLATALVVFGIMSFEAVHTRTEIQDTISDLCLETMINIELNLREEDAISAENLYRFDQLTAIFPETYYAVLSDTLLVLEDPAVSSRLTREDRDQIANDIARTYANDMYKEEWEPLIYDIENVLYPYMQK